MNDNEMLVEQAIADFAELPFDKSELYKRYSSDIKLSDVAEHGADGADAALKSITGSAGIKFDLRSTGEGISSSSSTIRVSKHVGTGKTSAKGASFEDSLYKHMRGAGYSIVWIDVPEGATAKLNFLLLNENPEAQPVIVANIGKDARLRLFEWVGSAIGATATRTTVNVVNAGPGSITEISVLHNESDACDVGTLNSIKASDNASVKLNCVYNGGNSTKSSTMASAEGTGSKIAVNEIVLGNGSQSFDLGAFTLNAGARSDTTLRSGTVLKDRSLCTLKGYAKVTSGASGSRSYVEERGLVMDSEARMRPLPDMSIDCKDVASASHSASAAPIDAEKLFYLMSRGIDETRAKRAFVASFLSRYLASIADDTVKEIAISVLLDKLDNGRHATVPRISPQSLWIVPGAR